MLSNAFTTRFLARDSFTKTARLVNFHHKRNDIISRQQENKYQFPHHRRSRSFTIPRLHDEGKENDVQEEGSNSLIEAPTVKNIIRFAIPAIGIWLCGPLLSLIDTSAVGMLSGTSQQAALNPAITITDDGALLVVSNENE
jgi:hypothetical protein